MMLPFSPCMMEQVEVLRGCLDLDPVILGTFPYVRDIERFAVEGNACVMVSKEIVQAGKLLDIEVLDHIIIGQQRYISLKAKGLGFN